MKLATIYAVVKGTATSTPADLVWQLNPKAFQEATLPDDVVAIYGGPDAEDEAIEHAEHICDGWGSLLNALEYEPARDYFSEKRPTCSNALGDPAAEGETAAQRAEHGEES